jgi:hypothetical protein
MRAPISTLDEIGDTLHDLILRNPDNALTEILAAVALDIPMAMAAVESQLAAVLNSTEIDIDPVKFDAVVRSVLQTENPGNWEQVVSWINEQGGLEVRLDPDDPDGWILGITTLGFDFCRVKSAELKPGTP